MSVRRRFVCLLIWLISWSVCPNFPTGRRSYTSIPPFGAFFLYLRISTPGPVCVRIRLLQRPASRLLSCLGRLTVRGEPTVRPPRPCRVIDEAPVKLFTCTTINFVTFLPILQGKQMINGAIGALRAATGCSLNIVFFFGDLKIIRTLAFLCFSSLSVCVHTPAGRTPAL